MCTHCQEKKICTSATGVMNKNSVVDVTHTENDYMLIIFIKHAFASRLKILSLRSEILDWPGWELGWKWMYNIFTPRIVVKSLLIHFYL
jgi:hypothetical protein